MELFLHSNMSHLSTHFEASPQKGISLTIQFLPYITLLE